MYICVSFFFVCVTHAGLEGELGCGRALRSEVMIPVTGFGVCGGADDDGVDSYEMSHSEHQKKKDMDEVRQCHILSCYPL